MILRRTRTRPIALACACAALPLLAATPALAYVVQTTSAGAEVRWALGAHPLLVDGADSGTPGETSETLAGAARSAAATWNQALPSAPFSLVPSGGCDAATPVVDPTQGRAAVIWTHGTWSYTPGVLALTFTAYDASTGAIAGTRTVVDDADYQFGDDAGNEGEGRADDERFDLQSLLTHELGHALGLAHSLDPTAVMWATQAPNDTSKRTLKADDLAGLTELYVTHPLLPVTGCRVAGGWGGGTEHGDALLLALILFAGPFALRSRRRRLLAPLGAIVLAALFPARAKAASAIYFGPAELTRHADLVVHGRTLDARVVEAGDLIVTATTVAVAPDGCLAGECNATVTVWTYGGELPDGRGQRVEGAGRLPADGEVVLFLHRVPNVANTFVPVGLAEGIYLVEHDGAGAHAVRDLDGLRLFAGAAAREGGRETVALDDLVTAVEAARLH